MIFLYIVLSALFACLGSQFLKAFFNFVIEDKKFRVGHITSDGDYPSSHTSFITCITTISWIYTIKVLINVGVAKTEMWISVVLTALLVVIVRDALGVRLTVQKLCECVTKLSDCVNDQSKQDVLQEIKDTLNLKSGHKPHEVIGGAIFGLITGMTTSIIYYKKFIYIIPILLVLIIYVISSILLLKKKRLK